MSFPNMSASSTTEYNSTFSRIHKEMLNLICIYFVPEQLKQMRKEFEQYSTGGSKEINTNLNNSLTKAINANVAEIASSLSSYCTSIMKVGQFNVPLLIFVPKIECHHHQLHPCKLLLIHIIKKKMR